MSDLIELDNNGGLIHKVNGLIFRPLEFQDLHIGRTDINDYVERLRRQAFIEETAGIPYPLDVFQEVSDNKRGRHTGRKGGGKYS